MKPAKATSETRPAAPKRRYSDATARGAVSAVAIGSIGPEIVADVPGDEGQGDRDGKAGYAQRPAAADIAQPVHPEVDAAEADHRRQRDAGRDQQPAPGEAGNQADGHGHRQ